MKQEMKNGKIYDFETVSERELRLSATAETIYLICKSDSLTISDYERTKALLDNMVYNRTIIRGQSNT